MSDSAQIIGAIVLTILGVVFHFVQEDRPLSIISISGFRSYFQAVNQWIAAKFGTTNRRVVQVEVGVLLTFGFTMIQIGEYFVALLCWLALACIWVFKACDWPGVGSYGLTLFLKTSHIIVALLICAVLMTITVLRKADGEPWSNLQKLEKRQPISPNKAPNSGPEFLHGSSGPWSLRVTSLVTNGAIPLWGLDDREALRHHFCKIPMLAEVYLTNNQTHWTMITNLHIEAMDVTGTWRSVRAIDTDLTKPICLGADPKHVREVEPTDRRFFDRQIVSRNIGPGETPSGWLFVSQDIKDDIKGSVRISVSDLQGGPYQLGSGWIGDTTAMKPGGFETMDTLADLTKMKEQNCALRPWE